MRTHARLQHLRIIWQHTHLLSVVTMSHAAGLPLSIPPTWLSMHTSATLVQVTEAYNTEQKSLALTPFHWVKTLRLATIVSGLWCLRGCGM